MHPSFSVPPDLALSFRVALLTSEVAIATGSSETKRHHVEAFGVGISTSTVTSRNMAGFCKPWGLNMT